MFRTLMTLVTLLSFTACSTMQALPDVSAASVRQNVQPGDSVRVETHDGKVLTLQAERVTDDTLYGTAGGEPVQVPLASIRTLKKARAGEGSSGWGLVGVLAAVALIVVLVSNGGGGGGDGGGGY